MKRYAECVITGVTLVLDRSRDGQAELGYPADLFDMGDVYIINANPNAQPSSVHEKARIIYVDGHYWERRSVYVVAKSEATLNQAAIEYINGTI